MKVYIGTKNGVICTKVYASIKMVCDQLGVSYHSASRGKREWNSGEAIVETELLRIKRR